MDYLKSACFFKKFLIDKLIEASYCQDNEWFFIDGAFDSNSLDNNDINTWYKENFAVINKDKIIGYIEGIWNRPLDIISSLRIICFDKKCGYIMTKACYNYIDYLFMIRDCKVINWSVAEKNKHAKLIYEKFISKFGGRCIGKKSRGQKSYFGKISDVFLYELTKENYLIHKNNKK